MLGAIRGHQGVGRECRYSEARRGISGIGGIGGLLGDVEGC